MSLVPCRHCGHDVSATAHHCPHCGGRAPTPKYQRDINWTLAIFALMVALPFLWIMHVCA